MPTEHEYKYVLANSREALLKATMLYHRLEHIEQGYIVYSKGTTARIRKVTAKKNSDDQHKKTQWFFTFKSKVDTRTIELEQKIDSRDGEELWCRCIGKLRKKRYIILDDVGNRIGHKAMKWEVDFFFDQHDHLYFVMAEVELPEGSERPETLPAFIEEYLLYAVPLTDDRFSNKRLGDVAYTKELYKQLQGEKHESIYVA